MQKELRDSQEKVSSWPKKIKNIDRIKNSACKNEFILVKSKQNLRKKRYEVIHFFYYRK